MPCTANAITMEAFKWLRMFGILSALDFPAFNWVVCKLFMRGNLESLLGLPASDVFLVLFGHFHSLRDTCKAKNLSHIPVWMSCVVLNTRALELCPACSSAGLVPR